ncbi:glycine betaine/L-proline ABC transporter, ATP binding subunit OpuBA [Campylobacter pinnipediorum subsp. caledonicus]|uniref:Glycine betaine/L-proline ABC transporter, ATP binding subunit OpuBA n=2 Tax=Campylobacter TaxID=194 RepID=A0A1S6U6Y8_9BACT|nr:ABC transporter ATP-binding protein [Campylobacter pinnipediorum]AQW85900.1 glycine betaine/L-proline ABC transporter, ATP binding subunit OpuBA [Campylobacter pinnipediorum subsp. caledonicus]AQW87508.1 glycine betaine/L-proline ABC transporter, ATP binding subunit OpuBA [Campylobacter pinnipediorum subsp. caledonicus]OPA72348.1 glycine/betaine ABC transporter ATP-binding protein [Campylobacter pinnipediorum subsp. caledonicus]
MISMEKVTKIYNDNYVIKDQTLNIKKGEFFVLVGPSGSGKTTTLKMLNRLIEPTSGVVKINGKDIKDYDLRELRLDTGYVLQQIALFPNLTVLENISLIPEMKKWSKKERIQKTIELLKKVKMPPEKYLHRYPRELSGGEQQRIGILRAIITRPQVILMDEPFSALDPISRQQLQDLIKELHKDLGMTIVFVTHDMQEAEYVAERICIMRKGEIMQIDSPKNIKDNPANEFVAKFFQAGNTINE